MSSRQQYVQHELNQRFNYNGDLRPVLVEEEQAIEQSIENILETPIGSRFFQPEFGSNILNMIYEPLTEDNALVLFFMIVEAIRKWEPRVEVDPVQSRVTINRDDYEYVVAIVYRIVKSNKVRQFERTIPVGEQ